MVVAGDSAGGGLTLALAVLVRDAGSQLLAALACLSPWTDLAATGESIRSSTTGSARPTEWGRSAKASPVPAVSAPPASVSP